MEFLIENWQIIVASLAVLAMLVILIFRYSNLPHSEQIAKVREWLLWAVTEAEKSLGGGTGKLKLRQVYDMFIVRFPWLAEVISFDLFSGLVDDALEEMREMLKNNEEARNYVEGAE